MNKNTIGLKVDKDANIAKCVSIIRKYSTDSMAVIKDHIYGNHYVLEIPYSDRHELKTLLNCYNELVTAGISASLFELDGESTTIEFLINLDKTYNEISDEIDSEDL